MFTRQHYETIAKIILVCTEETEYGPMLDREKIIEEFTRLFKRDNCRFDPAKFEAACYTPEELKWLKENFPEEYQFASNPDN